MSADRLPNDELEKLVSLAADDLLDPLQTDRLADLLLDDAEAQDYYLRYMGLSASLEWNYVNAAAERDTVVKVPEANRFPRLFAPLAAIAAMLCVALLAFQFGARPHPLVTVDLADGAFFRGEQVVALRIGQRLPAGEFFVEGATGSAQLRFEDGTLVTVGGGSEVSISAPASGKRLDLRAGVLSADVASQPAGKPLRIGTPAAEVEVMGTILTVNATPEQTGLSVAEGAVRMRRLVDGNSIQVPARHHAVASLDAAAVLLPTRETAVPGNWTLNVREPNARITKGRPLMEDGAPRLSAVPVIVGRGGDHSKVVRSMVAINGKLVQLSPDSRVRIRYRAATGPVVFLSVTRPTGRFGGNFEVDLKADDHKPDVDGWRTAEFPITEFGVVDAMKNRGFRLAGSVVQKALVSVHGANPLELAEIGFSNR